MVGWFGYRDLALVEKLLVEELCTDLRHVGGDSVDITRRKSCGGPKGARQGGEKRALSVSPSVHQAGR